MKKIKINKEALKECLKRNFKFSIYEIALAGIFVALWAISALPVFSINFGFMRMGITYVWPILLGLTAKPVMAVLCAVLGDSLALLSSGTGFAQWMPEYAIIPIMIVAISWAFRKVIYAKSEITWLSVVMFANATVLLGTLITMIVENDFVKVSKNPESAFQFTGDIAKIIVWTMYGIMMVTTATLLALYFLIKKGKAIKLPVIRKINGSIKVVLKEFQLDSRILRQVISFYSLSMIIIVVTIWIWGPFAQIRYLEVYMKTDAYKKYDLFLIPRILKTPISLVLYTVIIVPIYKTHEIASKRIGAENRW